MKPVKGMTQEEWGVLQRQRDIGGDMYKGVESGCLCCFA